jgi:hypothetical protein
VTGWENSKRAVVLTKIPQATKWFNEMIEWYAGMRIFHYVQKNKIKSFAELMKMLQPSARRAEWINVGGQLILKKKVDQLKTKIKSGKIKTWDDVHEFYHEQGEQYDLDVLHHAFASLLEIKNIKAGAFDKIHFKNLLSFVLAMQGKMETLIKSSREKDYTNPFRKMTYENEAEMNKVLGSMDNNTFILDQNVKTGQLKKAVQQLIKSWKL